MTMTTAKTSNLTFKELYLEKKGIETPATSFINRIAKITGMHPQTVRQWAYGNQNPSADMQKRIARELKTPVEILFPIKDDNV